MRNDTETGERGRVVSGHVYIGMRPFSRRLAGKLREERRRRRVKTYVCVLVLSLILSGVIVHAADRLYLASSTNISVFAPSRMVAGGENEVYVFLHKGSGSAIAGDLVSVSLKTGDTTIFLRSAYTDEAGLAVLRFPLGRIPDRTGTLLISAGGMVFPMDVVIDSVVKIYLNTDKPIYQPGQTVHVRTLTFLSKVAYPGNVTLTISDPEGNRIFRETVQANEFGVASYNYTLGRILPLGVYTLSARVMEREENVTFLVEKYVLPKMTIDVSLPKDWYAPDEILEGVIYANYTFGRCVNGRVKVEASIYTGSFTPWMNLSGEMVNGVFPIKMNLPRTYNVLNAYIFLNVSVTDTAGHTEEKSVPVPVSTQDFLTSVIADTNVAGARSDYYIIVRSPDGNPVQGAVVRYFDSGIAYTNPRGVSRISFIYNGEGSMSISISRGKEQASRSVPLSKGVIKVLGDEDSYKVGDTAVFDVYADGIDTNAPVYYQVVSSGSVITSGQVVLKDRNRITIKVMDEMAPLAEMRVSAIKDGRVYTDAFPFSVTDDSLKVTISTPNSSYLPKEDVPLNFRLTSLTGDGVRGIIGVSIVDTSVYEINERFRAGILPDRSRIEAGSIAGDILAYALGSSSSLPAMQETVNEQEYLGGRIYDNSLQVSMEAQTFRDGWVATFWEIMFVLFCLAFAVSLGRIAMKGSSHIVLLVVLLIGVCTYSWVIIAGTGLGNSIHGVILAIGITIFLIIIALPILAAMGVLRGSIVFSPGAFAAILVTIMLVVGGYITLESMVMTRSPLSGCPTCAPGPSEGLALELRGPQFGWKGTQSQPVPRPGYSNPPEEEMRSYFPETWRWEPSLITDANGEASLMLRAPDTITTWKVNALASTRDAKVAFSEGEIKVFKKLFVEPDIPVAVVLGDEFELKALIYNYDITSHTVRVTLQNESWFDTISQNVNETWVGVNDVRQVNFTIRVKDVGLFTVTMHAEADGGLKDSVRREITSIATGKKVSETRTGSLSGDSVARETLPVADDMIRNSSLAFVKIFSGSDPVIYDGAKGFIHHVTGCGEQSTSLLSVDILAYRNAEKNMTPEEIKGFKDLINQGIQHEMTFIIPAEGGRAMSWHGSPEPPDIWLTAWAIQAFKDLRDAGFDIDERLITDMAGYLKASASPDGSYIFPDVGHWSINDELKNERLAATAYILRAVAYAGIDVRTFLPSSVAYVRSHMNTQEDNYTLALGLDAMVLSGYRDETFVKDLKAELERRAVHEGELAYWVWRPRPRPLGDIFAREFDRTNNVEATGYAVMALARFGRTELVTSGARYLLRSMNGFGVWGSTHETAIALQALNLVRIVPAAKYDIRITVNGQDFTSLHINDKNNDLMFLYDLTTFFSAGVEVNITFTGSGDGEVFYVLYYEYYVPWSEPQKSMLVFSVDYSSTRVSVGSRASATVRLAHSGKEIIRMALIEVTAPTGFAFVEEDFQTLKTSGMINDYEFSPGFIRIYIDNLTPSGLMIRFSIEAIFRSQSTQPGACAIDLYHPGVEITLEPVHWTAW